MREQARENVVRDDSPLRRYLNSLRSPSSATPDKSSFSNTSNFMKDIPGPYPLYNYKEIDRDAEVIYIRDHNRANFELERVFYPARKPDRLSRVIGFDIEWRSSRQSGIPDPWMHRPDGGVFAHCEPPERGADDGAVGVCPSTAEPMMFPSRSRGVGIEAPARGVA